MPQANKLNNWVRELGREPDPALLPYCDHADEMGDPLLLLEALEELEGTPYGEQLKAKLNRN